ncbi:hypothetical protein CCACVL1_25370 [Corchorus capsularis]|uniref:Uncharacterized protein n=1 Tax=Corchorus capsularis TaxID=210143 RepID=A0A1R3GL22_COCAP|nr:hypothetical protein CCACVL1_25370 [Corchorus capsularis]
MKQPCSAMKLARPSYEDHKNTAVCKNKQERVEE